MAKPHAEAAAYIFNWLSMTGTGILISAFIAGKLIGASFRKMVEVYSETLIRVRYSLLTIAAMLALGYTTRDSGLYVTLGLAFAQTPHPGPPSVRCLAGSAWPDRLRHGLKRVVRQLAADFVRAARPEPRPDGSRQQFRGERAKSKTRRALSLATATKFHGQEGVSCDTSLHSIALACLVVCCLTLQAYVWPMVGMVVVIERTRENVLRSWAAREEACA